MNGMVLLDGDFLEKHVAGLTNGMNPFGEKEVGASSVVMPVCFPNTNIPSFFKGEDVVVTATPLVGCSLFDNLVAKVRFQSPTVILAPMNCFLLLQNAQVAESSIPKGGPLKLKCRISAGQEQGSEEGVNIVCCLSGGEGLCLRFWPQIFQVLYTTKIV